MAYVAKVMEELRRAATEQNARQAQHGYTTKFSVRPLPKPRHGCLARFLVRHSYSNGVPISNTKVAIGLTGHVAAVHPRFMWDHEGRGWGELFREISNQDVQSGGRRRR